MMLRFANALGAVCVMLALAFTPKLQAQEASDDPRVGLAAGYMDAAEISLGMELISNTPRPDAFHDPDNIGDLGVGNSDLAFQGNYVIIGNFNGFNIYDISNAERPRLRLSVTCPGGQGDVSIYENLLFMSVEEARGRIDCGFQGTSGPVDPERFRGVRVFDLSNIDQPRQVAAVQTCRGSHTHTVVPDPNDDRVVYVYNSGSSYVRPNEELEGCSRLGPDEDPNTSLFRIEVIRVSLDAPQDAQIVSAPRVFADEATGDVAGLWRGGDHGEGTQRTAVTNHCHDITAFPEIGLAAGACSGNGILLDITDPVNPVRIDEVSDPNFAYWHSATFSNDGSKVIFTDEWGGGTAARCRATDPAEWGANAIYNLVDGRMEHAGYFKLPAPQTATENCVAHNGSLIPVPGRDIMVQSWYQGGISIFDFTDPSNPFEIAYFDRGPLSDERLFVGGHWSSYWYDGRIYGSEIARGLDVFRLTPTEFLSENEIRAAEAVRERMDNIQTQERFSWPAHYAVPRAYLDQLERDNLIDVDRIQQLRDNLSRLERTADDNARRSLREVAQEIQVEADRAAAAGRSIEARRMGGLAQSITSLLS